MSRFVIRLRQTLAWYFNNNSGKNLIFVVNPIKLISAYYVSERYIYSQVYSLAK